MWWMRQRGEHRYTMRYNPASTSGRIFLPAALLMVPSSVQGLIISACHIIDCHLTQDTTVYNAVDIIAER